MSLAGTRPLLAASGICLVVVMICVLKVSPHLASQFSLSEAGTGYTAELLISIPAPRVVVPKPARLLLPARFKKARATMLGEKTSHLSGGKDDDVPQSQLDKAVPWFKKWYPNWVKERTKRADKSELQAEDDAKKSNDWIQQDIDARLKEDEAQSVPECDLFTKASPTLCWTDKGFMG